MTLPPRLRSLLFAPAVRPDLFPKLAVSGADAVVLDCEDATPADAKPQGRTEARRGADALLASLGGPGVSIRVNAVDTEWHDDDLASLPAGLAAVVVPKIERLDQLDRIAERLDELGLDRLGVMAGIETVLGALDARPLLAHPRVVAGYFGAEDYIADLGGVRTGSNHEVATARALVAMAARVAGVAVLDQVVTAFRDDERFEREANEARELGYSGKLCIHPAQVRLANSAFVPGSAEVERARALLAAYDEAIAQGLAAFSFEGQMVDEPLAAQARRILAAAD